MSFITAIVTGVISALLVHQLSWFIRLRFMRVALISGGLVILGLVFMSVIFLLAFFWFPNSGADGAYVIQTVFAVIWAYVILFAFVIGALQAHSLPAPWWKGVLSACYEAGLGFLTLAGVNYSLQWIAPYFERIYLEPTGPFFGHFIQTFALSLLTLAVIRPVVRLKIYRGRVTRTTF